jgi:hypothetical protein
MHDHARWTRKNVGWKWSWPVWRYYYQNTSIGCGISRKKSQRQYPSRESEYVCWHSCNMFGQKIILPNETCLAWMQLKVAVWDATYRIQFALSTSGCRYKMIFHFVCLRAKRVLRRLNARSSTFYCSAVWYFLLHRMKQSWKFRKCH